MSEVHRRCNAVASDVLDGSLCALFTGEFGEQPGGAWAVPMHGADEEPYWLNLSAKTSVWAPGGFDDLLRAVADDKSGPVLLYAIGKGKAFSPYDGGADLFLASKFERDELAKRYNSWLSALPSGL